MTIDRASIKRRICLLAVGAWLLAAAGGAAHAADQREKTAVEAFAARRYQEALNIFAQLYSETLHPAYLRNIGRCYQKLEEPDKAIDTFKEYLRVAKDLSAAKRAEVNGFIREMEDLKSARAAEQERQRLTPPPPPPRRDVPPPAAAPVAAVTPAPIPVAEEGATPVYRKWWFWTAIAVGVAAAAGGGIALSRRRKDAACSGVDVCM